jgi:hypothetical protein
MTAPPTMMIVPSPPPITAPRTSATPPTIIIASLFEKPPAPGTGVGAGERRGWRPSIERVRALDASGLSADVATESRELATFDVSAGRDSCPCTGAPASATKTATTQQLSLITFYFPAFFRASSLA